MILVAKEPIARETIHRALLAEGFERIYDPGVTGLERTTEWARAGNHVAFVSDMVSGVGLFFNVAPENDLIQSTVMRVCPVFRLAEYIEAASNEQQPGKEAAFALGLRFIGQYIRNDDTAMRDAIAAVIKPLLLSDHRAVRNAAIEAIFALQWPAFDETVAQIGPRFPDFAWIDTSWSNVRAENDERNRQEAEARAKQAMLDALPTLVDERRWDEALGAAEKLLADKQTGIAIWRARSLALQGLGRTWEAALSAALWHALGGGDEADRLLDEVLPALPGQDTVPLGAALLAVRVHVDDKDPLIQVLEALLARQTQRADEISFLLGILRIKSYTRSDQKPALALLERAVARFPRLPHAWCSLALARAANDDIPGAEQAYRESLRLLAEGHKHDALALDLAHFSDVLDHRDEGKPRPLDARRIHEAIRWLYKQQDDKEALIRIVNEQLPLAALADDTALQSELLQDLAIACTATKRHEEAITAYQRALAALAAQGEHDDEGLLSFNLACELARFGRKEKALAALRDAIRADEDWADKARSDAYFESIWDDRDFLLTVSGFEATPDVAAVEQLIRESLGSQFHGDVDAAVKASFRAMAGAEAIGDPALLLRSLKAYGSALTYSDRPERAVDVLERAVRLREQAPSGEVAEQAEIRHLLGAALHAVKRWDEAEQRYLEALELRVSSVGRDDPMVAKSYGDLGRLAADRDHFDRAEAWMQQATDLLDRFLANNPEPGARVEALVDRALNAGNGVTVAVQRGAALTRVLDLADGLLEQLDALDADGIELPAGITGRLRNAIAEALQREGMGDHAERLEALAQRIFAIEQPDPQIREEKFYWMRLRQGIRDLKARGVDDATLVEGITEAIRGQNPGEPLASHAAFDHLAIEFARRLRRKTDLVMVAMTMDLVKRGAQPIEEAIDSLEAFAVANLLGTDEDTDEDEGQEDD